MDDSTYVILTIVAMGAVTFAIRALPFMTGRWLQRHPHVRRLGRFLPLSIMVLLTLHSLLDIAGSWAGQLWPEVLALTLVIGLQWWRRHALLSIAVGTLLYLWLRNGF